MRSLTSVSIVALATLMAVAADQPEVKFISPCECEGNHGVYRWDVKTDLEAPPDQVPKDHKIKPSDIAAWAEPRVPITTHTPRSGREKEWFELTGKVVLVRAEADGDLHIQLVDADHPSGVNVVVEIPVKQHPGTSPWCALRTTVFTNWSSTKFPFTLTTDNSLDLTKHPVIRVEGKAFFDATHKGPTPNRRKGDENVCVWEIHPVMVMNEVP